MREQILAMMAALGEVSIELQDVRRSRRDEAGWLRPEPDEADWTGVTGEIPAVQPPG